jgi:hypothetical protein
MSSESPQIIRSTAIELSVRPDTIKLEIASLPWKPQRRPFGTCCSTHPSYQLRSQWPPMFIPASRAPAILFFFEHADVLASQLRWNHTPLPFAFRGSLVCGPVFPAASVNSIPGVAKCWITAQIFKGCTPSSEGSSRQNVLSTDGL